MVSNKSFTSSGGIGGQAKSQKKELSGVNHVLHTKLSQLYSTARTIGQSSGTTYLEGEGTSSLIGPELDKDRNAPWKCARRAWGSHFSFNITATDPRGAQGSLCLQLMTTFHLKMWNDAQVQAHIIWSFQVKSYRKQNKKAQVLRATSSTILN